MNFLRRGSRTEPPDEDDRGDDGVEVVAVDDRSTRTAGKGRPTPSRRQAQGKRRGPAAPAPRTQREAFRRQRSMQGSKADRRAARAERNRRMAEGDDSVLPARDQGPIRGYARDVVDSRRNLMGLFMPLALVVFVFILVPNQQVQAIGSIVCIAMLMTMLLEGLLLGRHVNARVRHRFPEARVRSFSLGWYSVTRATQIRRMRMPKPRVSPGTNVD